MNWNKWAELHHGKPLFSWQWKATWPARLDKGWEQMLVWPPGLWGRTRAIYWGPGIGGSWPSAPKWQVMVWGWHPPGRRCRQVKPHSAESPNSRLRADAGSYFLARTFKGVCVPLSIKSRPSNPCNKYDITSASSNLALAWLQEKLFFWTHFPSHLHSWDLIDWLVSWWVD